MDIWSRVEGETLELEKYRENKGRAMRKEKRKKKKRERKKIGTYDNSGILLAKLFVLALGVGGRAARR